LKPPELDELAEPMLLRHLLSLLLEL